LNPQLDSLINKLDGLLGWERRKRREQVFFSLFCAAWALAIALFPLHVYFAAGALRWWIPLALLAGLAPYFFFRQRWRREDATRALVQVDKTLRLDERVVTAWELSRQTQPGSASLYVLQQAEEKLRPVNPEELLPRRWGWAAYGRAADVGA
jgi:hypothetical protein